MPCSTITTVGVQLTVSDLDLLVKALEALKLSPVRRGEVVYFGSGESFNKLSGELRVRDQATVARIKQAYSAEVVKSQARRFDTIRINVLEDGTIRIETDKVSAANHTNAEGLIREMVKLAGGPAERKGKHGHQHAHGGNFHGAEEHEHH